MVDLLVSLNSHIEGLDDRARRLLYHATKEAGIDRVLEKLQSCLQSVSTERN
jgi:hypothetical protein